MSISHQPTHPSRFLLNYFHEIGHILGDDLSFTGGEVLSPIEARRAVIPMALPRVDQLKTDLLTRTTPEIGVYEEFKPIADAALQVFSRGRFDPQSINFYPDFPEDELRQKVIGSGSDSGVDIEEDQVYAISSREGRNVELPAVATTRACTQILENTLKQVDPNLSFSCIHSNVSAQRAERIVNRAYDRGWVIPSLKDLQTNG